MDSEHQAVIKKLVDEIGAENLVVVLGSANPELAEVIAKTVTVGDPSFAGPLAGVSLRLLVCHILESEVKAAIPAEVYEQQAGFMEMVVDTEEIGRRFKEARRVIGQDSQ
jgi:glycine/sarcosine/betaine reductase complex component A